LPNLEAAFDNLLALSNSSGLISFNSIASFGEMFLSLTPNSGKSALPGSTLAPLEDDVGFSGEVPLRVVDGNRVGANNNDGEWGVFFPALTPAPDTPLPDAGRGGRGCGRMGDIGAELAASSSESEPSPVGDIGAELAAKASIVAEFAAPSSESEPSSVGSAEDLTAGAEPDAGDELGAGLAAGLAAARAAGAGRMRARAPVSGDELGAEPLPLPDAGLDAGAELGDELAAARASGAGRMSVRAPVSGDELGAEPLPLPDAGAGVAAVTGVADDAGSDSELAARPGGFAPESLVSAGLAAGASTLTSAFTSETLTSALSSFLSPDAALTSSFNFSTILPISTKACLNRLKFSVAPPRNLRLFCFFNLIRLVFIIY